MSEYVILSDSACDLPVDVINEYGIDIIPISYVLSDKEYENRPDHSEYPIDKFYKEISGGAKVSTAALGQLEIKEFMEKHLREGKDIIYLAFSSGLSSICGNASVVAENLKMDYPDRKITVVDSLCASNGFGLFVYLCLRKKAKGAEYEEIVEFAESIKQRLCHEFTVDDLGQLKRGGRISPTTAFFGSMLQIKPVLYVSPEGKLVAYTKVRGRHASLKMLADKILNEIDTDFDSPIFIGHGDCEDEAEVLADMIREKLPNIEIRMNYIGPVIGAHSGYKTMSIFCISKKDRGAEREKSDK